MSDVAIGGRPERSGAFDARAVAVMIAVGVLAFVGMLVLGAYAPDLRSGRNGGAHALSNAAVGFSGIVRLAEATGRHPRIVRDPHLLDGDELLVLTPETGAADMTGALAAREGKPTLVILPKWLTVADKTHAGWVRYLDLKGTDEADRVLAPHYTLTTARYRGGGRPLVARSWMPAAIRFAAPRPVQTIAGAGLTPLLTDARGHVVLGQLGDRPLYVLADPDLLSNIGMRDAQAARAALDLLDRLNAPAARSIRFDVTLDGLGRSPGPLRLAFEPPFLAMTLAIAVAVVLAAIQASARFGPPRRRVRAIAFGKTALIDNAAALVRKAGRRGMLGRRYLDLVRDRAVTVFGVPARLRERSLDGYLDGLQGRVRFTELAEQARAARDARSMLHAAQALHRWLWEKTA